MVKQTLNDLVVENVNGRDKASCEFNIFSLARI